MFGYIWTGMSRIFCMTGAVTPSIAARLPSKAPGRKWWERDASMDPASIPKEDKLMIEIAAIEGKVNGLAEPLEKPGHLEQTSLKGW